MFVVNILLKLFGVLMIYQYHRPSQPLKHLANPYETPGLETGSDDILFTPVCQTSPLSSQKICDTSLSVSERVASLVASMTQEEKILNLVNEAAGAPRIGLPPYEWWNEALHGVADSPGVHFPSPGSNFSYATSFGAPILTGAAFDDPLVYGIAKVIGKEARAFANHGFAGFNFWTPDINSFRDPRWGRGQEVPGEDSFHVQSYIKHFMPGLEGEDREQKQIIATCKHYAAYDLETGRAGNNYNPTLQDLADYFLAPFKTCVRDIQVGSVMCSYNSVHGIPTCASEYLLEDVLRQHWNWTSDYNFVVSDCGAIAGIHYFHNFTDTVEGGAAVALNAGTDLDCLDGRDEFREAFLTLGTSIAKNYTAEAALDRALARIYTALFTVGYFDGSEYSFLAFSDVGTPNAQYLAYKAAAEGMTLLKNDGLLPLDQLEKHSKVAMIGPLANATHQMQGSYSGTAKHLKAPFAAFQKQWKVTYAMGTGINTTDTTGFSAALEAGKASDLIFYLGGIDNSMESENGDRTSISWPGNQLDLISELSKLGKPLVVIQFGGGQIDDTALLDNHKINSLLWVGYPGQDGGRALLDIITGKQSVAGRLPITQYPASYADEVSLDINLRPNSTTGFPGRTYKWYTGTPVIPFGFGLHYTDFKFSWATMLLPQYGISHIISESAPGGNYNDATCFTHISVVVENIGERPSDYVGLLFISSTNAGPEPRPNKSLISYARLHDIPVRGKQQLDLELTLGSLARADEDGNLVIFPGDYTITLDIDARLVLEFTLTGKARIIDTLPPLKKKYNFTVPVHMEPPASASKPKFQGLLIQD